MFSAFPPEFLASSIFLSFQFCWLACRWRPKNDSQPHYFQNLFKNEMNVRNGWDVDEFNLTFACVGFHSTQSLSHKLILSVILLTRFNSKSIAFIVAIFYTFLSRFPHRITAINRIFVEYQTKNAPNVPHESVFFRLTKNRINKRMTIPASEMSSENKTCQQNFILISLAHTHHRVKVVSSFEQCVYIL